MLEPVLIALLLAQVPSGLGPPLPPLQVPHDQPYQVPIRPAQPQPQGTVPQNLRNWPKSCQRLHLENQRCELGYRTCNQRHIDYWRKKCEHDEPHAQ